MKLATIGTSWIVDKFITAAQQTKKWELSAVYSRDIQRANVFAEKYGCERTFDNLKKMAESDIDAVYIASPNSLHCEQSKLFLEHKKHVICEKPMCTSLSEFQDVYETADRNNVFLFEAFKHINCPAFECIRQNLHKVGVIRGVTLSYNQYSSKYDAYKSGANPNVFTTEFHGGALNDLGVYPISLAVALFGKPQAYWRDSVLLDNGVDGSGVTILRYKTFLCTISYSKVTEGYIENEIVGEDGAILIDKPSLLTKLSFVPYKKQRVDLPTGGTVENDMIFEADLFADCIAENNREKYFELREISRITNEIIVNEGVQSARK